MNCPVCDLRMVCWINTDEAICPDHGAMTGIFLLQLGETRGWQALVELRASQLNASVWRAFDDAKAEMQNVFNKLERERQIGPAAWMTPQTFHMRRSAMI